MPKRALTFKGEECSKCGKKSKDHPTALLWVNCDGSEKPTPLVKGKSERPI